MSKTQSHAEILADIAAQVVEQHRYSGQCIHGWRSDHCPYRGLSDAPIQPCNVDPSWDYTLPDRFQDRSGRSDSSAVTSLPEGQG